MVDLDSNIFLFLAIPRLSWEILVLILLLTLPLNLKQCPKTQDLSIKHGRRFRRRCPWRRYSLMTLALDHLNAALSDLSWRTSYD